MAEVYIMRRRWLLLVIGLPLYTFGLMVVSSFLLLAILTEEWADVDPWDVAEAFTTMVGSADWWGSFGPCAAILVALQVVFVIPLFATRPPREPRGRSLTVSLVIAGLIAGALTMGLGTAAVELIGLVAAGSGPPDYPIGVWMIAPAMLVLGWVFWSALLLLFCRGIWADRTLGRLVGILFAGTLLELLVVLPLDIMVRRRTDCYCLSGTFFTLGLAGLAGLWLAGPGVIIALKSKKHRMWRESHCIRCGYAKGPSPGPRCAECGLAWLDSGPNAPRKGD